MGIQGELGSLGPADLPPAAVGDMLGMRDDLSPLLTATADERSSLRVTEPPTGPEVPTMVDLAGSTISASTLVILRIVDLSHVAA